jgi:hypothetical protein
MCCPSQMVTASRGRDNLPDMSPQKPERQFHVGQKIRINLHSGRIEEATIRAIVEHADGLRLQVDLGFEQTALIHEWQVVEDAPE